MILLGHEDQVKARFGMFGDSLILMQDRCMICAEHTTGSEIILHALIELVSDGSCGISFQFVWR
jgi:hypothetical protein